MRNPILAMALGGACVYLWGRLLDWYRAPRDAWDHLAKRDRIR